jgi:hypothetical protein
MNQKLWVYKRKGLELFGDTAEETHLCHATLVENPFTIALLHGLYLRKYVTFYSLAYVQTFST